MNKIFLEKGKNLQFFKQFILNNSEACFQKAETRFQNTETCFQNANLPCPAFSLQRVGWIPHKKACVAKIL